VRSWAVLDGDSAEGQIEPSVRAKARSADEAAISRQQTVLDAPTRVIGMALLHERLSLVQLTQIAAAGGDKRDRPPAASGFGEPLLGRIPPLLYMHTPRRPFCANRTNTSGLKCLQEALHHRFLPSEKGKEPFLLDAHINSES